MYNNGKTEFFNQKKRGKKRVESRARVIKYERLSIKPIIIRLIFFLFFYLSQREKLVPLSLLLIVINRLGFPINR